MNNEEKILKILEQQGKTLESLQKDMKSLKKSVSYISKTVHILVRRTDEGEVALHHRMNRVEKALGLPPFEYQRH